MLDISYTLQEGAPPPLSYQEYGSCLNKMYAELLDDDSASEKDFQSFFENHPCMMPGHSYGNQNHGIPNWSLISQPSIESEIKRVPDFMWITETSTELIPVLIEIESPSKKMYRKHDGAQNALYSQAYNQIEEWRVILSSEKAQRAFFDRYEIPTTIHSNRKFSPHFILIFGRRREFSSKELLAIKRADKQSEDYRLMSFDRLSPSYDAMCYATTKYRENGRIEVQAIPPTFQLGPELAGCLTKWSGLSLAINKCALISPERKAFLIEREAYWREWAQAGSKPLRIGDWE